MYQTLEDARIPKKKKKRRGATLSLSCALSHGERQTDVLTTNGKGIGCAGADM